VLVGLVVVDLDVAEVNDKMMTEVKTTAFLTDWALSRRLPTTTAVGPRELNTKCAGFLITCPTDRQLPGKAGLWLMVAIEIFWQNEEKEGKFARGQHNLYDVAWRKLRPLLQQLLANWSYVTGEAAEEANSLGEASFSCARHVIGLKLADCWN
jgi:hypothetical protein